MLETQSHNPGCILACTYSGVRGTPVYFPSKDFPKLKALNGDSGAGKFLQGESVVLVSFPGGEYDIDCQEDLSNILVT
jgi:CTP:molybdopterin cytidylyltransferase MocA